MLTMFQELLNSLEILIYLVNTGSCELMLIAGPFNFSVDLTVFKIKQKNLIESL